MAAISSSLPSLTAVSDGSGSGRFVRIAGIGRGRQLTIIVDGRRVEAFEGEMLGVALAAAGQLLLRHSPSADTARGMFCLMGVCQECAVMVDGAMTAACMLPVQAGMSVETDVLRTAIREVGPR